MNTESPSWKKLFQNGILRAFLILLVVPIAGFGLFIAFGPGQKPSYRYTMYDALDAGARVSQRKPDPANPGYHIEAIDRGDVRDLAGEIELRVSRSADDPRLRIMMLDHILRGSKIRRSTVRCRTFVFGSEPETPDRMYARITEGFMEIRLARDYTDDPYSAHTFTFLFHFDTAWDTERLLWEIEHTHEGVRSVSYMDGKIEHEDGSVTHARLPEYGFERLCE